jgi:radical SAM family protein
MASHRPRVLVLEFTTGAPGEGLYDRRVKLPNYLGVMPQAVAAWSEELGGDVTYRTYTGSERPADLLEGAWDVAFLSAYTRAAHSAYGASAALRDRGTVTALGGPHAVAYPGDALGYFDYVFGPTDRDGVARVLDERARATPAGGRWIAAPRHPARLPRLRARARFLDAALAKSWLLRVVPLLSSVGCPYACEFCSDALVEHQTLPMDDVEDDLACALERYPGAVLFWMDPTFGVRLDPVLAAMARVARGRRVRFGAESTLALLTPERLAALARAGCAALLPGIEDWHQESSKLGGARRGAARVAAVAEQVNAISSAVPYVQVNFVLGLDGAPDDETLELTSTFLRASPGAWPSLNLATAWGISSPLGERLHREGRVLPVPFPLLDQKSCSNVVRLDGTHEDLYRSLLELEEVAFAPGACLRRAAAGRTLGARAVNAVRAGGSEMRRRRRWHRTLAAALRSDRATRAFFAGERVPLPPLLRERALRRTGPFTDLLPRALADELRTGRPRAVELRPGHCRDEPRAHGAASLARSPAP